MLLLLAGLLLQRVLQPGAWLWLPAWVPKVVLCAFQAALLILATPAVCALLPASRQLLVLGLSPCGAVVDLQAAR
jgi:hypothetical protein